MEIARKVIGIVMVHVLKKVKSATISALIQMNGYAMIGVYQKMSPAENPVITTDKAAVASTKS